MRSIRIRLPGRPFSITAFSLLANPLATLTLLYFMSAPTDYLHIPLLLFKAKLTNLIAFSLFLCALLLFKVIRIPQNSFLLTLAMLGSMSLSASTSINPLVCIGFILFFAFSYLCYFLTTYNLFRFFASDALLKIYSYSFYCTGIYALCQVLFSLCGVSLPGVDQYILGIARGQAFAYEPSFYALYMTPFTMYSTASFILQDSSLRRIKNLFWPNLFLLASTSTGCFFSYLFFLFFMIIFQKLNIIKTRIRKLLFQFSISFTIMSVILWTMNKDLITSGFLKFFYSGVGHFSLQDRWRGLIEYWTIFLENPLIGVGFGAGPFYIAQQKSSQVNLLDSSIFNRYCPMNATTEVLAGLGTLGALLFLYFFYFLINTFRTTLKIPTLTQEERMTLIALALSICVMFSTLQFNQSIMRSYMWIHIGFFCGYANALKNSIKRNSTL